MEYVIIDVRRAWDASDDILVVEKHRPNWQKGRLNLVGGKIEPGESIDMAARRELLEETGYFAASIAARGRLIDGSSNIWCITAKVYTDNQPTPQKDETERPFWYAWKECMADPRLIPNLRVIIPMMRYGVTDFEVYDEYRSKQEGRHKIVVASPDPPLN